MKNKIIKRPRFAAFMAAALIPALIVAFLINLIAYYAADSLCKRTLGTTSSTISTQDKDTVIDLYFADRDEEQEREYLEKMSRLYARFSAVCIDYFELYDGSDMIFSTRTSGFVVLDEICYRLTDDPEFQRRYLDTVGDCQTGNIDYWRLIAIGSEVDWSSEDPYLSPLFRLLRLSCPKDLYFPYTMLDIYVDRENLIFYPGQVEFYNLYQDKFVMDFSPSDTTGLEHIVREVSDPGGPNFVGVLLEPHSDNNIQSDYTYEQTTDAGNTLSIRRVSYVIPSLLKLFPVHTLIFWMLVTAVCCLIAYFVARYRYGRIKAMYDMIEYRRTTANAMAHDLKTPLAILSAYADNMSEEQDPGKLREYSFKMRENVESANRMLEDILDFSRSESGKITSNKEQVSLSDVISASLDLHSDLFKQHGIKIKRSGSDLTLQTDRKLLSQAVDNLISNCARHATDNTTVDIDIKDSSLSISNRTDLKTDNVEELLKPFVKGSSSRGDTGTGLGLSVARNDLEIIGYKLSLDLKDERFTATVRFK